MNFLIIDGHYTDHGSSTYLKVDVLLQIGFCKSELICVKTFSTPHGCAILSVYRIVSMRNGNCFSVFVFFVKTPVII